MRKIKQMTTLHDHFKLKNATGNEKSFTWIRRSKETHMEGGEDETTKDENEVKAAAVLPIIGAEHK